MDFIFLFSFIKYIFKNEELIESTLAAEADLVSLQHLRWRPWTVVTENSILDNTVVLEPGE